MNEQKTYFQINERINFLYSALETATDEEQTELVDELDSILAEQDDLIHDLLKKIKVSTLEIDNLDKLIKEFTEAKNRKKEGITRAKEFIQNTLVKKDEKKYKGELYQCWTSTRKSIDSTVFQENVSKRFNKFINHLPDISDLLGYDTELGEVLKELLDVQKYLTFGLKVGNSKLDKKHLPEGVKIVTKESLTIKAS